MSAETRAWYARFAAEARAIGSPLYGHLSESVASNPAILDFLDQLPASRRQPNLLLAAVRHVAGLAEDGADLAAKIETHGEAIAALMRTRTTQTNEPGRCATLLPVLGQIEGPLALLEVGASAGFCLLPDLYGYRYGEREIAPGAPSAPILPCDACVETPLPRRLPQVAWRAGLDLAPIDPDDPEAIAWLQTLIFPEQQDRATRLESAIALVRAKRPRVVAGDLRHDLSELAAQAPRTARLVIYHTAVLCYVPGDEGQNFASRTRELGAVWISNESPDVFPHIAAKAPARPDAGCFLLAVNGAPVAWTHPHGRSIAWFADPPL
ncbi:MAG: DUF2332 domain-containing protein [Pseudomonadota bacterium]